MTLKKELFSAPMGFRRPILSSGGVAWWGRQTWLRLRVKLQSESRFRSDGADDWPALMGVVSNCHFCGEQSSF
jgi:hypothetical protein